MLDKEFDQFFSNRLGDHPSPVPDDMWQRIHGKEKDRKAFLLWKWYFVGPLCLILCGLAGYFIFTPSAHTRTSSNPITTNTIANPHPHTALGKSIPTSGKTIPAPGTAAQNTGFPAPGAVIPNPSAAPSPTRPTTASPTRPSSPGTTRNPQPSAPLGIRPETSSTTGEVTSLVLPGKTSITLPGKTSTAPSGKTSTARHRNPSPASATGEASNELTNNTDISHRYITIQQNPSTASQSLPPSRSDNDSATKPAPTSTTSTKPAPTKPPPASPANKKPAPPGQPQPGPKCTWAVFDDYHWYLEVYGSPDLPLTSFGGRFSYSGGLRVGKSLGKGFSVIAGLQYSRINLRPGADSLHGAHATHFKNIDLPLLIGYERGNDRFRIIAHAGLIYNIHTWPWADGFTQLNRFYRASTGISLYGGLEMISRLNDRFTLFAEPHFRYQLTNMIRSDQYFTQKINVGGLNLGVRYNFKK